MRLKLDCIFLNLFIELLLGMVFYGFFRPIGNFSSIIRRAITTMFTSNMHVVFSCGYDSYSCPVFYFTFPYLIS